MTHGTSFKPSTYTGRKIIDHILTRNIEPNLVRNCGQLPAKEGFSSDHRAMFADIKSTEILHIDPVTAQQAPRRQLNSKNEKHRDLYVKELTSQLVAHNVFQRTEKLLHFAKTGSLTEAQMQEYNRIDHTITSAMLSAERKLPKNSSTNWTAQLNIIVHKIRYFRLLLQKHRGISIPAQVLKKFRAKANETTTPQDEPTIRKHLKEAWNTLDEYKKEAESNRDAFLAQLLNTEDKATPETQSKAILNIKKREKSRYRYRKIRGVLRRIKGVGLTSLEIPI